MAVSMIYGIPQTMGVFLWENPRLDS